MNRVPAESSLVPEQITSRLYTIRNIANLAAVCPQEEAEIYVLQDVIEHISGLVQSLIEEIGEIDNEA